MKEQPTYSAAQMREAFVAGGMSKLQFRDYLEAEARRRWPEKPGEEKPYVDPLDGTRAVDAEGNRL